MHVTQLKIEPKLEDRLADIANIMYIDLALTECRLKDKVCKSSIFSRWYWKKRHNKIKELLFKAENDEIFMGYVKRSWSNIKPITPTN